MHVVSNMIPKNVRDINEPCILSSAKETPNSALTGMNVSKFCWQTSAWGGHSART